MTENTSIPAYDRSSLVTALRSSVQGNRLGTEQIRSLIESREKDMSLVAVELTSVFYELGFSDEHKEFFNGSFRSMLRNALRQYGSYGVRVSYKRTREYTDGDRELPADDSGNWYWHVEVDIQARVKSDEDHQEITESHEVVGQPVELTETEKVLNKVLDSEGVDRVEAAQVLLNSLTKPAAAFVVQRYLEASKLGSIRDIRKAAQIQIDDPEPAKAVNQ